MAQRLERYRCGVCEGSVVVMRGGSGTPACCDRAMMLSAETREEAAARKKSDSGAIPVNLCTACGVAILLFTPPKGVLTCCGQRMMAVVASDTAESANEPLAVPPLEYNLNVPVKVVLEYMQQRFPSTTYFGIDIQKSPLDFWVYQEMFFELRPDVIVEIGNYAGGALLAYAHLLEHMGHGRLIGVDVQHELVPPVVREHRRITLLTGDACAQFDNVRRLIHPGEKVLIIEDSSHTYENTLNVLRTYCRLVTPGSYFIVEDSNCHHGVDIGPFPGPYEAIADFLKDHPEFETDRSRESFFITWNPMGYLRRKAAAS